MFAFFFANTKASKRNDISQKRKFPVLSIHLNPSNEVAKIVITVRAGILYSLLKTKVANVINTE